MPLFLALILLLSVPSWAQEVKELPIEWGVDLPDNQFEKVEYFISQLDTKIPLDIIRAVAEAESNSRQFRKNGKTVIGPCGEIGVMQISPKTIKEYYPEVDIKRLYTDIKYNIETGVMIFEDKLEYVRNRKLLSDWTEFKRKYNLWGQTDIEMAVRCYNSLNNNREYLDRVNEYLETKPWGKRLKNWLD
jgi:hypothetical protein